MTAAVAATWADLLTFVGMLALLGPEAEANPIVRAAIAAGLLGAVIAAKVGVMLVLALWERTVGRFRRPVALTGVVVGLTGATSNLLAVAA